VVFGKGESGNFSRLYKGIKDHMFAYPGRKDTIKACVYVKELVRFILWNVGKWSTPPLTPPRGGEWLRAV